MQPVKDRGYGIAVAGRDLRDRGGMEAAAVAVVDQHQVGLLAGAAASFECFNRSRYEEGDHVIFVGEVERCSHRAGAAPLLYHGGKFYAEHPL